MKRTILLVEDEPDIAELVKIHLTSAGFLTIHASSGEQGLAQFSKSTPDLVVLDIMLPGIDGFQVCQQIRQQNKQTPLLMLTSKSTELDRVSGLELGADDYLTKPFSVVELLARIKALFRRVEVMQQPSEATQEVLEYERLSIDPAQHQVIRHDKTIDLTAREFDLLLYLALSPGQVFSRAQLLGAVWGYHHEGYEHTVSTHINRLRIKLELDPSKPQYVHTVWGVGYKFNQDNVAHKV